MTSTTLLDTAPPAALRESTPIKEATWCKFVAGLDEHRRAVLFSSDRELDWHDEFVRDRLTILQVSILIQEILDR